MAGPGGGSSEHAGSPLASSSAKRARFEQADVVAAGGEVGALIIAPQNVQVRVGHAATAGRPCHHHSSYSSLPGLGRTEPAEGSWLARSLRRRPRRRQ